MNEQHSTPQTGPDGSLLVIPILVDLSAQPGRERELIAVLVEMVKLAKAANRSKAS